MTETLIGKVLPRPLHIRPRRYRESTAEKAVFWRAPPFLLLPPPSFLPPPSPCSPFPPPPRLPCLPPPLLALPPLCTVSTPSCLKPLESSLIYETHKRFDSQPLRCFPNLWNLLWGAGSSDLDINSDERRSAHSQCPRSVYIS